MNLTKYRKLYLTENYGMNNFIMIEEKVNVPRCFPCPYSVSFQMQHKKILSGEAFWITHNKLCIGYHSRTNSNIFRPIFSHKRQIFLDMVHYGEKDEDEDEDKENKEDEKYNYSIITPHLNYARKKYLLIFNSKYKKNHFDLKKIPQDCVEIILFFINKHLYLL